MWDGFEPFRIMVKAPGAFICLGLILAERGNIARLHVYHAVVAIALPQKLGHDFGRLPRLHELARDEARQFAILKPGGAG